jgi:hypothetical protein
MPRTGEIKTGGIRWTVHTVCMENKQYINHCTFKTSIKHTNWDTWV